MKKPATTSTNNNLMQFKNKLKGFYLILSSLFISLLHLPFAFAKTNPLNTTPQPSVVNHLPIPAPLPLSTGNITKSIYDSLHLNISGLSRQAFDYAQKGWTKLIEQGRVINQSIIAIVDFSQPSNQKRLFILDMNNYKVLFNTLVAHGKNSGKEWASSFSNQLSSYKSSPGFYITGETYNGDNGYSLKLTGVEEGINDNARTRAIVMHGADYVNESYINSRGYIGRSQGCPAVPRKEARKIINTIKDGTCLFLYAPTNYISRSSLLS